MKSVHSDIGLQYPTEKNLVEIPSGFFITKAIIPAHFSPDQIVILKE